MLKTDEDLIVTERKGHATEIVKYHLDEFEVFCSVGGDGTLNEVANGLVPVNGKTLAVLPCGSGNDFAKTISIGTSLENDLTIIRNGKIKPVDYGSLSYSEDKNNIKIYFINSLGFGFDALVAQLIKKTKYLKGSVLYLYAVIKALKQFDYVTMKTSFDENENSRSNVLAAIGNGKFSGGGFMLNPTASIDDKLLDVCVINKISIPTIIQKLPLAIFGKHTHLPYVQIHKFRQGSIQLDKPAYIHLDGEVIITKALDFKIGYEGQMNMMTSD